MAISPLQEPLVLLLHPLPFDGRAWEAVQEHLARPSLAPDLYGLGASVAGWAASLARDLPRQPLLVVGCSVGGSCALELARLLPDRVAGLVLLGTKPGVRPDPVAQDEALRRLEDDGLHGAWQRYWLPLFGPAVARQVVDRAEEQALSQPVEQITAGVRAFHDRRDNESFLLRWRGPVVLADGQYDLAPERSARLAAALPAGTFHSFPGVGHYSPLEAPQEVAALIERAAGPRRSG